MLLTRSLAGFTTLLRAKHIIVGLPRTSLVKRTPFVDAVVRQRRRDCPALICEHIAGFSLGTPKTMIAQASHGDEKIEINYTSKTTPATNESLSPRFAELQ